MKKFKNIIIPLGLILFSYLNIYLFNIRFSIEDDYLLCNIISGALGDTYDFQLLYINNILGIILKLFYQIIPFINIYTLYLITLLCMSFTQIVNIVVKNKKFLLLPIAFLLYILTLYNITYTIIAYLAISIGFVELLLKKDENDYYSYFFIINGVLLRAQTFLPVFGVLGIVLIYNIIKNNKIKKIISISILITLIIGLNIAGNLIYKTDHILNDFKQWQDASIKIRDYKIIDYNKYETVFKNEKWNENDLKLFYSWNFADKEKYTVQGMKNIAGSIDLKDKYNLDLLKIITNYFSQFFTEKLDINNVYIIIYILLFLISIINTKNKKECFYVFLATIMFNLLLIVRERNLFRVVYPQYLVACIYFIYQLATDEKMCKAIVKTKCILGLSIAICAIFTVSYIFEYNRKSNDILLKSQESNFIVEQLKKENNIFILSSNIYNELTMNYKISKRKNIGEYSFLIKAGGGDCFSKRYYDFIQRFNLENSNNLYKNLKQNNVFYIGNVDEVLVKYLKENVDENWNLKEVKRISNIAIYQYQEDNKNN